jgi:hypothetical protein
MFVAPISLFGNNLNPTIRAEGASPLICGPKAFTGAAESGQRVLEVVGQELHIEQVFPGRALGPLFRLCDGDFPFFRLEVAAPDPGQPDERASFVDIR